MKENNTNLSHSISFRAGRDGKKELIKKAMFEGFYKKQNGRRIVNLGSYIRFKLGL